MPATLRSAFACQPFVRALLTILATVCGAASCTSIAAAEAPRRPNVLVLITDEHNFRTLGCYRALLPPEQAFMWGPKAVVDTPHHDWIAAEGAIATSFYATTPVCSPSRAAWSTGQYPHRVNMNTNDLPLSDDVVTYAEVLRRHGYATGFIGKWHLDGPGKPQWAPARNFGFTDNRYMFNRGHWKNLQLTPEGPRVGSTDAQGVSNYNLANANDQTFTTDFLTNRAVEFVRAHASEPFCLTVSYPDPHGPDTVRAPYDTMYLGIEEIRPRTFDVPTEGVPSWGAPAGNYEGMARYFGMIRCIDDNFGRLFAELRQAGVLDHTIIVMSSDHGDLRGEHHRQNKGVPYEASARSPFLMRYPGVIPAGTVVNEALSCVDFMPTLLALLQLPGSGREEGRNAASLFTKSAATPDTEAAARPWDDVAILRSTGITAGWAAAVSDRYKLVLDTDERPWLLDLEIDADEVTNWVDSADHREITMKLADALRAYGEKYDDPRIQTAKIQYDLDWVRDPTLEYDAPPKPPSRPSRAREGGVEKAGTPRSRPRSATEDD